MHRVADLIAIGQIVGPHGVRGELKIQDFAGYPARFATLKRVFLPEGPPPPRGVKPADDPRRTTEYRIAAVRTHQGQPLLTLEGVDDRDKAEALRGQILYIAREDRQPLAAGEYYQADLIGLTVLLPDGIPLGTLAEIIETGANDVYEVRGNGRTYLIPATKEVLGEVDLGAGILRITPIPGLLEGGEEA
ncbi:MAG TPA: ribosome maturation factor RimM [bacterium]|nr:ribosome maturation factor RimM [bacterium]